MNIKFKKQGTREMAQQLGALAVLQRNSVPNTSVCNPHSRGPGTLTIPGDPAPLHRRTYRQHTNTHKNLSFKVKFSAGYWHSLPQAGPPCAVQGTCPSADKCHLPYMLGCDVHPLTIHSCPGAQRPLTVPHTQVASKDGGR